MFPQRYQNIDDEIIHSIPIEANSENTTILHGEISQIPSSPKTHVIQSYSNGILFVSVILSVVFMVSFYSSNQNAKVQLNSFRSHGEIASTDYEISIVINSPGYDPIASLAYLPWDAVAEPYKQQFLSVSSFAVDGVDYTSSLSDVSLFSIHWNLGGVNYEGQNCSVEVSGVGVQDLNVNIVPTSSNKLAKVFLPTERSLTSYKKRLHKSYNPQSSIPTLVNSFQTTFTVSVKYVRREIRSLSEADRTTVLDAMKTLYEVNESDGQLQFGGKYHSADYFSAKHLLGAGTTDCDHWHDGSAITVKHVAFTLEYEQSLQSINKAISLPYWEYAYDAYWYANPSESEVFGPDMFGILNPSNLEHRIDDGSRWEDVRVSSGDSYKEWSIKDTGSLNPYVNGLNQLRSPWNNNPTAHISRSNMTYGHHSFTRFPTCDSLYTTITQSDLADTNSDLNGITHGPTHIIIGGAWDYVENDYDYMNYAWRVLFFKILWRNGLTRCPTSCSDESCRCYVPQEYIDEYGALGLLEKANVISTLLDFGTLKNIGQYSDDYWLGLLRAIEHPGVVGEMYTSNAAFDPSFWSVHGTMDRLLGLKRVLYVNGDVTFNETWAFPAYSNSTGEIYLEGRCDWSDVLSADDLTLPSCDKTATCAGHGMNDLIPFSNFLGKGEIYRNIDFYNFIHPWSDELPYTYDTFLYALCAEHGYDILDGIVDDLVYKGYSQSYIEENGMIY